jgi:hypothetical protein
MERETHMFSTTSKRLHRVLIPLVVLLSGLVLSPSESTAAAKSRFFEETAQAFWAVPHECADGSTVEATLLVETTRDFESPDTEDADPTARVQYLAVCPDGTSFSWIVFGAPATITSTKNLKSVTATGSGIATDIFDQTHEVTFDVTWTAVGPLESTVNGPGSTSKQREATATGRVTFDDAVLVDGPANHPTRPAPFIRVDIEK